MESKFAVQRDADGLWLTVYEGNTAATTWLSWDEAEWLRGLAAPDGENYLNRNSRLGPSYGFSESGAKYLLHDLSGGQLTACDKAVLDAKLGIDATGSNGGLHDAPHLSSNAPVQARGEAPSPGTGCYASDGKEKT